MNDDFLDMLIALDRAGARYLVVGAHALALHGLPRATGYLDLWVGTDPANAQRVWQALSEFGAPVAQLGVSQADPEQAGTIVQLGLPPRRIDILTSISGVDFDAAWSRRDQQRVGSLDVAFIAREDLAQNKRASGRAKDLLDLPISDADLQRPGERRSNDEHSLRSLRSSRPTRSSAGSNVCAHQVELTCGRDPCASAGRDGWTGGFVAY